MTSLCSSFDGSFDCSTRHFAGIESRMALRFFCARSFQDDVCAIFDQMELFINETFDTTIPAAPDSALDTLCMIGENRGGERGDACCSCGVDFDN